MNLLVTGAFKCTDEQKEKLNLMFSVDYHDDERSQVQNPEKYDAVICNGLFLYNDIERFTNLKIIQLTSAGLDRVPLQRCKERGIEVKNARGVYSTPISEWTVLKILEIYKFSHFFKGNQNKKVWVKNRDLQELSGKEAMIVGFGDIGQKVAKRLRAFDVSITAVDVIKPKNDLYDKYCLIDEIKEHLPTADIVVLTLPLNDKTRYMFDKEMFSHFKQDSVLINVSRGAVIKESDLLDSASKFLGIALDVFEGEVLEQDNPLWNLENIIITPHNAFVSQKNQQRLFELAVKNLTSLVAEKSKKICIVTTQSSSINYWIRPFFEPFNRDGYDVTILTTYPEGFEKTVPDYIKCKYVKMGRGVQTLGALKAIFQMWKFFRKEKFDIVQYSTPNASMYASIASYFAGIRCRLYCQWGIRYYEFTGIKRKFFKFIEKLTCSFSTNVSPASISNGLDAIKKGLTTKEKVHTVWNGTANGIDFSEFNIKDREAFRKKIREQYGIPENAFVYGFLGRILWDKGVPELIEAFLELREKYDDIYLMITGYFEREHMFDQDILRRSKECDHIFWTGKTDVAHEYFASYDVLVFPAHRDGGGGGIIRAGAMGTPSIVSDIGPLLDVIQGGKTSLSFKVRDKEDLKAQMEKIYLDRELHAKLTKLQYQNFIENFERTKFTGYYLEYRNELIEKTKKKK